MSNCFISISPWVVRPDQAFPVCAAQVCSNLPAGTILEQVIAFVDSNTIRLDSGPRFNID
jgi:hypothetical protein